MTLVLPSYDDPVAAGAANAIGGRPGRRARVGVRRFWSPVRVLVALTLLTCFAGWLQKAPCRDGSQWVDQYQYTRACYSDVVALYSAEGLADSKVPYYEHPVEYPVLTGAFMQVSAVLGRAVGELVDDRGALVAAQDREAAAQTEQDKRDAQRALGAARSAAGRHFYDVTWFLLSICAVAVVVTTARLARGRPWDAALVALSPALLLHGTTNWDLLAVALAGGGLLAWARKRPVLAGVLLGLATATKLYPLFFLVPLVALCWRAGRLRQGLTTAVATVLAAAAVTLPVYLTAPYFADVQGTQTEVAASPLERLGDEGIAALAPHAGSGTNAVWRFVQLNQERPADWDALWFQVSKLRTTDGPAAGVRNALADLVDADPGDTAPKDLNLVVGVLTVLVLLGVVLLAVRAPRRPRLPQLLFLTVTGFLLVNKVDSPQYVLWLVPLAALSHPRWRPYLAWMAAEAVLLLSRFYFFIGNSVPNEGIDIGWFFVMVLVRDALLLVFAAYVVRDVLHPSVDPVRAGGALDDPAGGVLDGAPDRVLQDA